jgi:hypothetical protein
MAAALLSIVIIGCSNPADDGGGGGSGGGDGGGGGGGGSVTSISISGDDSAARGGSIILTSQVTTDPAGADTSVTWNITTAGIGTGTQLSSTTGATVTLSVDANESNASITVKIVSNLDGDRTATKTINSSSDNFLVNYEKLGLPVASYTAGAMISAMEGRVQDSFYDPDPILNRDLSSYDVGLGTVNCSQVAGVEPTMAFVLSTSRNSLIVYGEAINATIWFQVAVINTSDGTGWITGDGDNTYPNTYKRTYTTGAEEIPISSLTGGAIATAAGLSGYNVYIIVRGLDAVSGDFNEHFNLKTMNVIIPQ